MKTLKDKPSMKLETCETCKHWDDKDTEDVEDFGECNYTPKQYIQWQHELKEWCAIEDSYVAFYKDFGCIHHEDAD